MLRLILHNIYYHFWRQPEYPAARIRYCDDDFGKHTFGNPWEASRHNPTSARLPGNSNLYVHIFDIRFLRSLFAIYTVYSCDEDICTRLRWKRGGNLTGRIHVGRRRHSCPLGSMASSLKRGFHFRRRSRMVYGRKSQVAVFWPTHRTVLLFGMFLQNGADDAVRSCWAYRQRARWHYEREGLIALFTGRSD